MNHTIQPTRTWATNAAADYRIAGNAELHAEIESLAYDLADAGRLDPITAEVVRILCGARLKLAEAELRRRVALHAADHDVPNPNAPDYHAWRNLARDLRERGDLLGLFATAGVPLQRDGKEYSGPCPICGGADRFRVWSADDGKRPGFWCRRCDVSGDVIAAYRAFLVPGASFFAAVRVLALELGLRTPDHGQTATMPPSRTSRYGRRIIPLSGGTRRAG